MLMDMFSTKDTNIWVTWVPKTLGELHRLLRDSREQCLLLLCPSLWYYLQISMKGLRIELSGKVHGSACMRPQAQTLAAHISTVLKHSAHFQPQSRKTQSLWPFNAFLSLGVSHTSSDINKSQRVPGEHWGLPAIPLDDYFFLLAIKPTAERWSSWLSKPLALTKKNRLVSKSRWEHKPSHARP